MADSVTSSSVQGPRCPCTDPHRDSEPTPKPKKESEVAPAWTLAGAVSTVAHAVEETIGALAEARPVSLRSPQSGGTSLRTTGRMAGARPGTRERVEDVRQRIVNLLRREVDLTQIKGVGRAQAEAAYVDLATIAMHDGWHHADLETAYEMFVRKVVMLTRHEGECRVSLPAGVSVARVRALFTLVSQVYNRRAVQQEKPRTFFDWVAFGVGRFAEETRRRHAFCEGLECGDREAFRGITDRATVEHATTDELSGFGRAILHAEAHQFHAAFAMVRAQVQQRTGVASVTSDASATGSHDKGEIEPAVSDPLTPSTTSRAHAYLQALRREADASFSASRVARHHQAVADAAADIAQAVKKGHASAQDERRALHADISSGKSDAEAGI